MKLQRIYNRVCLSLHYRTFFAKGMAVLYRFFQNQRIKSIRKKEKITVLFIIGEASTWKTEQLYKAMLKHPRFNPLLGVAESLQVPGSKRILLEYLSAKGYSYIDLDEPGQSIANIDPDIKIYYKPYESNYRHGMYFDYNRKSLVCQINYGLNCHSGAMAFRHDIKEYAWKDFIENTAVREAYELSGKTTANKAITGLPMQDILDQPKEMFADPWRNDGGKKRIIYAPHHSFPGSNGAYIEYSTFLEFGELMLEMAKKYSSEVQWIFKPHPSLGLKLIEKWGEEKTEAYYREWEELPNAQVELGEYIGAFKYSDALIHDCSSFLIEYHYMRKPMLFLQFKERTAEEMQVSEFGYEAYKAHYHASSKEQIEQFIVQVIEGRDPMEGVRKEFFKQYLSLPNGKTACENIIDTILGD